MKRIEVLIDGKWTAWVETETARFKKVGKLVTYTDVDEKTGLYYKTVFDLSQLPIYTIA